MPSRRSALQRELVVGDRLERQAVDRRYAVLADRSAVLGGGIAHVRLELPVRMAFGGAVHVAVSRDLGQHRGPGDRGAAAVAVDDRALLVAEVPHAEAVDQAETAVAG